MRFVGLVSWILFLFCFYAKADDGLTGKIRIDGSSTVFPITSAAAEMFRSQQSKIDIKIAISGTGAGFKKFLDPLVELRIDIADASRPIKPTEVENAKLIGVEYIELPIGLDGIAVVVNPKNTFCKNLTVTELRKIWNHDSKITNWKDIRSGFPDVPLKLYGPGTEDGTYDYFVEAIMESGQKNTRSDYNASENDNQLVQGVAGDIGSLGYFGFAYYKANEQKIKVLGIDNGDGVPIAPTVITICDNIYKPLSRPLFIYVNAESAKKKEVIEFVDYLLNNAEKIVSHPKVGYVALPKEIYEIDKNKFKNKVTGTMFANPDTHLKPLKEIYLK